MSKKLAVTALCGGESTEHQISIQSAMNVVKSLNPQKYEVSLVYITERGCWFYTNDIKTCLSVGVTTMMQQNQLTPVTVALGAKSPSFMSLENDKQFTTDCVFPVLHGTHGEDGCMQGLLQLMNVPYVGASVLSSSICMDKDITKQLLRANEIPTAPWVSLTQSQVTAETYDKLADKFGEVLFVKPNSLGSSVGVARVETRDAFNQALRECFLYDERVIIEPCIKGREIECAVLGNEDPVASLPGEIVIHHVFYSYQAKYLDATGATTQVPADLTAETAERIRIMAVDVFKVLRCMGMLRVDFFLQDGAIPIVNEANTIPGFTNISLYPAMWNVSGVSYSDLLDQLIMLALDRHRNLNQLERIYMGKMAYATVQNGLTE